MRVPKTILAVCLLTAASAAEINPGAANLITHEWGTFTSVAGHDGDPVRWLPLSGPADLPCFVSRFSPFSPKGFPGLVRMETPVLYFYARQPVTLSVRVLFPQGWITEVYPNVSSVKPAYMMSHGASQSYKGGAIEWNSVEVMPDANPELPVTKAANHYFAARETDAAPVRVGEQWEKLLFYRGVGDFEVPLRPAFTSNGKLRIRNAGAEPIPLVILFENRGGKLGYRVKWSLKDAVELDQPELNGSLEQLRRELVNDLVEFGLYRREALAMVETWRNSWFEQGMRVFYIVPREQVDATLPLTITPAPASVARVFVGRVEVLSPAMRTNIESAMTTGDVAGLMKYGRFLDPFASQIRQTSGKFLASKALNDASGQLIQDHMRGGACVQ